MRAWSAAAHYKTIRESKSPQSLRNQMHSIYQKPNSYVKNTNAQKLQDFHNVNSPEDAFWLRPITTESRIVILKMEYPLQPTLRSEAFAIRLRLPLRPSTPRRWFFPSPQPQGNKTDILSPLLAFEHEGPYCSN